MARLRYLQNAPIAEALFDFRVSLPADFDVRAFFRAGPELTGAYQVTEEIRQFEAVFEMKPGKPVAAQNLDRGLLGFRYKADDGKRIAQFRKDGFTLNRLSKYTSWDDLCPEALRLWQLFVNIARPAKLDRLALRYINRLTIPPRGKLTDHITVPPPRFEGSPPQIVSFLMRQARVDPTSGYRANIIQALELPPGAGEATLTLDIDVFQTGGLGMTPTELRPVLDQLRTMKNEIFFGAITEATAARYE